MIHEGKVLSIAKLCHFLLLLIKFNKNDCFFFNFHLQTAEYNKTPPFLEEYDFFAGFN